MTLIANLDDWINFCVVVVTECLVCGMFVYIGYCWVVPCSLLAIVLS